MTPTQDDLKRRIEAVLDEFVRPGLRADGGDVEVVGVDADRIVQVRMKGACVGLPVVDHHDDDGHRGRRQGARPRGPLPGGRPLNALRDRPALDEPPWIWPRAAYVHVPFCAHKCGYCDFASLAGADHLADRYLDALEREIDRATGEEPQEVDTVFVGGGTPTRLDSAQLDAAARDDPPPLSARAGRRVDGRGEPGHARRGEGRRSRRGRRQPRKPGRPVVPARVAGDAGAEPRTGRGRRGPSNWSGPGSTAGRST